ncbi:uncharacterized protein YndB with AHSA1/START domain [Salana multivorans]|uniref:Uncharacterized protein YndB with AHSA1/START domain n=1 Tax=Salana multivorans TaxID=120377 RepID=A0A3N2D9X4_9MICO|nr:SRPBCC domain-containing protein [Salana multivorans]MBN8881387.1 hypothetical protein [Salana multivorans]OJX95379.1 MAG: hypothetical protein BGO96_11095 [Micrococcales bacterium 73-15]ROR96601.1 uncharacterized protein YndB with AHSA1/START domain [Salana multivorans]
MSTAAIAEIAVDLAANPAVAASAWTSTGLAAWWWPHHPDATYDFEPEVGRTFRLATERGGQAVRGEFLDVSEDFLAFSWVWIDEGEELDGEHVTVAFAPLEGGEATRVTVVQSSTRESVQAASRRWADSIQRLEAVYPG